MQGNIELGDYVKIRGQAIFGEVVEVDYGARRAILIDSETRCPLRLPFHKLVRWAR